VFEAGPKFQWTLWRIRLSSHLAVVLHSLHRLHLIVRHRLLTAHGPSAVVSAPVREGVCPVFSGGFSSWRLVGCADEDPARSSIFQQKCRHEAIDTRLEWYVDVDVDWVSERDGCDSRNEPLSLVEES
jgi:hypothetical protein